MQADTKLPPPWADDADLTPAEEQLEPASPAVVVPFPALKRSGKKAPDPEIQAAIAAIDARKRAIRRERQKHTDDEDEDAPAPKARTASVPVRPINKRPPAELARKGEQHPLYAWQDDLDKKIARNGGQLTDDFMCQSKGLIAAWKHAKKGDALLTANAGYVAAKRELAKIRADEGRRLGAERQSNFDRDKGDLGGWLYKVAERAILIAIDDESSALGKRIDTSKLNNAIKDAKEAGYSSQDASAFFKGAVWEHAVLVSVKSPKTSIVRSSDAPTEHQDGEAVNGSDWLDGKMEEAQAAPEEDDLRVRLAELMAALVADGRLTRDEAEAFSKHLDRVPQAELAKEYGLSQPTMSRWLAKIQAVIEQAAASVVY